MANAFRELLDEPMGRPVFVAFLATLLLVGGLTAVAEPVPELGGAYSPLVVVGVFAALFTIYITFGARVGVLSLLAAGVLMFAYLAF